eukprot:763180-Hanusia_phi.AAC.6
MESVNRSEFFIDDRGTLKGKYNGWWGYSQYPYFVLKSPGTECVLLGERVDLKGGGEVECEFHAETVTT